MKKKLRIVSIMLVVTLMASSLSFPTIAGASSLSLGKPCQASSQYSVAGVTYAASNAVDDDLDSSWYASPDEDTAYIQVDLGAVVELNKVVIYWGIYDYATDFTIQVSDSVTPLSDHWTEITPITSTVVTTQAHRNTTCNIESTEQRHIRIKCNEKNDWSYEIFELEVFNEVSSLPATPKNLKVAANTTTSATLNWDANQDAESYRLYRENLNVPDSKVLVYSGPLLTYRDTGLTANTTYLYTVSSVSGNYESTQCAPLAVKTVAGSTPQQPVGLMAVTTSQTYNKLSWYQIGYATDYILYRNGIEVYRGAQTSYVDKGLVANTSYQYTLKAYNASATSALSDPLSLVTMAGKVKQVEEAKVHSNAMSFKWTNGEASKVKIFRNGTLIATETVTSNTNSIYNDVNLTAGTTYVYKLVGINSQNQISDYYETFETSTAQTIELGEVTGIKPESTSKESIRLKWNPVENATEYSLYRAEAEDTQFTLIYQGENNSYADNNVSGNTKYNYYFTASSGIDVVTSETLGIAAQAAHTENHAYLPLEWFNGDVLTANNTESFISTRLDELEVSSIKYLLCDIGAWETYEGVTESTINYSTLAPWIEAAHARNMQVIACVNYSIPDNDNAALQTVRQKVINISNELVNTGIDYNDSVYLVDGMHIDFEPYSTTVTRDYLISVLTGVRQKIGYNKFLSVATPAKNGNWNDNYLRQIVELVDMVNPMIYDTVEPFYDGATTTTQDELDVGITRTKSEYVSLVKNTCIWYSDAIAQSNNPDCILSPTMPVYEDKLAGVQFEQGFPDFESNLSYYHLNYNHIREESLESLENAMLGLQVASEEGANIYSSGVFIWNAMVGLLNVYTPQKSSYYDYHKDMHDWMSMWVNKAL